MHLVINATEVGRQRGGNESYIRGLLGGLAELDAPGRITLLTCDWGRPLDLPAQFEQVDLGPYRRFPFLFWQQSLALRRLQADWYLANFFMPLILPCRGAVVVHDLSFRAHPEYFPRTVAWYMKWLTGRAIRQSERVLTCSEFSKQEILRFYPAREAKVVSMPYGVEPAFQPEADPAAEEAILARYGIQRPYILAVGNIHPRKNLARLLDAYQALAAERESLPAMVWVGLPRWESNALVTRSQSAGVQLPGFIAQVDLPTVYRQAECLVYPSLYEGFGMPPLEAMACGTPVIASQAASLPEVVGDAALMVDPRDGDAIRTALARLLDDVLLRSRLRQAGLRRAATFTWLRTAAELMAVLAGR